MNEIDSLVVKVDPIAVPLSADNVEQTCLTVTVKNIGEQIVVILRATIRICMSKQIAGQRIR